MRAISNTDLVDKQTISKYDEIDGLLVIEELLLFKGVNIAGAVKAVSKKLLDDMALVVYDLKVNATNRLYVGMVLDRCYRRAGLVFDSGRIQVPIEIYNKVKEINDNYKTKDNQQEE